MVNKLGSAMMVELSYLQAAPARLRTPASLRINTRAEQRPARAMHVCGHEQRSGSKRTAHELKTIGNLCVRVAFLGGGANRIKGDRFLRRRLTSGQ